MESGICISSLRADSRMARRQNTGRNKSVSIPALRKPNANIIMVSITLASQPYALIHNQAPEPYHSDTIAVYENRSRHNNALAPFIALRNDKPAQNATLPAKKQNNQDYVGLRDSTISEGA